MSTPEPPRCPHCGETDPRFFDTWKTLIFCQVCGKTFKPSVVEKDVNGVETHGEP